jgi:capsular polysaccharide biosynthesis protein
LLRESKGTLQLSDAVWFIERVYHNHSHWLTAHLPKLLLLKQQGLISKTLLPESRTKVIDESLEMMGLQPRDFLLFDFSRPLEVGELTVLGTDRFAPHLLRSVPKAFFVPEGTGSRRIFISRRQAKRRKLRNENDVFLKLNREGFEAVCMEDLSFKEQVELMKETRILCGAHGAGLTNMMFCPPGSHIIEIADLSFPNPNFYALASALGHHYWLLTARGHGDVHPLEKDLEAEIPGVDRTLAVLRQLN